LLKIFLQKNFLIKKQTSSIKISAVAIWHNSNDFGCRDDLLT